MQPSVPQQQRFHKKTRMAKLTTMVIVQSILILEHIFHNYRHFRVTQRYLFRILETLKLMSLQDMQWKCNMWLSSLDYCKLLLAFVSHAKANTHHWFPFAQVRHYNPDQTHLSCLSPRPWFLPGQSPKYITRMLCRDQLVSLPWLKVWHWKVFRVLKPLIKCLVTVIWYMNAHPYLCIIIAWHSSFLESHFLPFEF